MPGAAPVRVATPVRASPRKVPDGCQIGELFRLLGESYVLDILHLFLLEGGPRRFVDLERGLHMSPNTLSDRLRSLVKAGLLTRTPYNQIPPRVDYDATPKARELQVAFDAFKDWAKRNDLKPIIVPTP